MNTFLFILLASVATDAPDALAQDKLVSEVDFGRRVVEGGVETPTKSEPTSLTNPDDTKELLAETLSIGAIAATSVLASSAIMAAGILVYSFAESPQDGLLLGSFGATIVLPPLIAIGAMFLLTKPTVSAVIGTLAGYTTGLVVGVTIGFLSSLVAFLALNSLVGTGSSGGAIAGVVIFFGAVATSIFLSASLGAALGAMSGHTAQRTFLE